MLSLGLLHQYDCILYTFIYQCLVYLLVSKSHWFHLGALPRSVYRIAALMYFVLCAATVGVFMVSVIHNLGERVQVMLLLQESRNHLARFTEGKCLQAEKIP